MVDPVAINNQSFAMFQNPLVLCSYTILQATRTASYMLRHFGFAQALLHTALALVIFLLGSFRV